MQRKKRMALAGLLGSFVLSLAMTYWFLADMLVELTGISKDGAIGYALTLLTLLTVVRAVLILLDKDAATNFIDKWRS